MTASLHVCGVTGGRWIVSDTNRGNEADQRAVDGVVVEHELERTLLPEPRGSERVRAVAGEVPVRRV